MTCDLCGKPNASVPGVVPGREQAYHVAVCRACEWREVPGHVMARKAAEASRAIGSMLAAIPEPSE